MNFYMLYFLNLIKQAIQKSKDDIQEDHVDWTYLVQLSKEQDLFPIFVEEAVKYSSYVERPEYVKEMKEVFEIVNFQVRRTNAFLNLYSKFKKAGVYPLVMKGLICRELYGKLSDHRPSADEDILIPLAEYSKAKEILLANGYQICVEESAEKQLQDIQEVSFIHPDEKLHIELHINAIGRDNPLNCRMNECFENVFKNYRETTIQGVCVRTMGHTDHLLFLVLHAFKHFVGSGLGIRQFLDILLYYEIYGSEVDMDQLCKTLKGLKAFSFWSDIIHIGNRYLGFELHAPQKPKCPEELLENVMESGTFGGRTEAERIAASTMRNVREEELKSKSNNMVVVLWKAIFPSKAYMLCHAPYLEEKPWLLPIEWVKRWGRFLKRSQGHDGNLAIDSVKTSRRRMKMLKKYDLV